MSLPLVQTPSRIPSRVWTVSELTAQIKGLLASQFPDVWLAGEISKVTRNAGSGHVYFTLKDEHAVIAAKLWKSQASGIKFDLHAGLEVVVQGRIDVWEPRGEYSIIVQQMQPKGLGALELAFRQLFERLQKEGLFAPERKRALPRFPRRIVIITSATGAAVRDMLQILGRRWRDIEVWIRSVRVQGEGAAAEMADALAEVNRLRAVDVIVLARGGGSIEDLWAFNEEILARAIFASPAPVVSAVGHEVDWTISDHVADLRAPTPSAAAELLVPNEPEVRERLDKDARRIAQALETRLRTARRHVAQLADRRPFRFPLDLVFQRQQLCDDTAARLNRAAWNAVRDAAHRLSHSTALLEGRSPLNILALGYSLTTRSDNGRVVRHAQDVETGQTIVTRLAHGRIVSRVEQTEPELVRQP